MPSSNLHTWVIEVHLNLVAFLEDLYRSKQQKSEAGVPSQRASARARWPTQVRQASSWSKFGLAGPGWVAARIRCKIVRRNESWNLVDVDKWPGVNINITHRRSCSLLILFQFTPVLLPQRCSLTRSYPMKRSIFQIFWKPHCCP